MAITGQAEKGEVFAALHEGPGAFVIPNPWDAGSACVLADLGFEALATTSSGFAFTLARPDGALAVPREAVLANARAIVEATDLPVSADLENAYGDAPEACAEIIPLAAAAGLVGCSIEDYSGRAEAGIYDFGLALERVQAAVEAAARLPFRFTLTARAENLIRGRDDLNDTIRRLQAYEAAGADVLYAPGLNTVEALRAVTSSVSKPVNALASPGNAALRFEDYAEAGVKRISVGGTLARIAVGAFMDAARAIAEHGDFGHARHAAAMGELDQLIKGRY